MQQQLDFPSDFYALKYDSPIERIIGECLGKHVDFGNCKIIPQYEVHSTGGTFFLDYLIETKGHKYAIECDGKEFHEYFADLYRDAWLLGEKHIDEMIRFTGSDLFRCPSFCMLFLYNAIPGLMTERNAQIIETKARNERWEIQQKEDPEGVHYYDEIGWEEPLKQEVCCGYGFGFCPKVIYRHNRFEQEYLGKTIIPEWGDAFNFITEHEIVSKEDFVRRYPHRFDGINHSSRL